MSWQLSSNSSELRKNRWRDLPSPTVDRLTGPEGYLADDPLIDAVNTALYLGRPLLVTGEPGCGKTELANFLTWKLGLEREISRNAQAPLAFEYAIRFDTKSETKARDLFYTIDVVERFHAAHQEKGNVDPLRFITFQALGRAILYANVPGELSNRLPEPHNHPGEPRRSVVLIDEIDKAPHDVPNDLLMEIEGMRFFIPELNRTVSAPVGMRPIVVITSNSEKVLPDAFLRRCVYYHMAFPDAGRLKEIVASRVVDLPRSANLLDDAVFVLGHVRQRVTGKKPGTAELLDFVLALRGKGYGPYDTLRNHDRWFGEARVTLLKTTDDRLRALDGLAWPEHGTA